jgi:hypothetical protein
MSSGDMFISPLESGSPIVWSMTVAGSDTNLVVVNDLNIQPGEIYKIFCQIKNNMTTGSDLCLFQGDDTNSNYRLNHIERNQVSFTTDYGSYSSIGYINEGVSSGFAVILIEATLSLLPTGFMSVMAFKNSLRSDLAVFTYDIRSFIRTAAIYGITTLKFQSGSYNLLGVGSKFTIMRIV